MDVVQAVNDRMDAVEPVLHALCTPTLDLAREQAEDLAGRIAAGEEVGPLAGVPVGIKDLVATRGIRTAMGSKGWEDFVPDEDDIVVERLEAGLKATRRPSLPPERQPVQSTSEVGIVCPSRGVGAGHHRQHQRAVGHGPEHGTWTAEDLTDAVMTRKAVNNKMWRFMADYDLLLAPALTVPRFRCTGVGVHAPQARW